jgi:2-dehydropantoate 2-reductase
MRIAVIGAGAVGGAIAALLHGAGHEVEVTARGSHLGSVREDGIRLRGAWGDHDARVSANETLAAPADLVIVTTKAQDAAQALADNRVMVGGAPLLVVQNGLEGLETARVAVPSSPVVGGLAMFAASYLTPGEITITTAGTTYIGGDATASATIERVLGAVMPVTRVDDFAAAQWTKLVVNQVNALPAITGLSVQEVIARPALRRVLTVSMCENVRVGHALGVRFASLGGLGDRTLRAFAAAPLWLAEQLPRRMRRRMGSTPNLGSTLQSIRRGQPSEIDFLNGAVVEAGVRAGVPTPVNALIVRLVHEVEASKAFIVPEVVAARVAMAADAA